MAGHSVKSAYRLGGEALTPHAGYDGQTFYFCGKRCREEFLQELTEPTEGGSFRRNLISRFQDIPVRVSPRGNLFQFLNGTNDAPHPKSPSCGVEVPYVMRFQRIHNQFAVGLSECGTIVEGFAYFFFPTVLIFFHFAFSPFSFPHRAFWVAAIRARPSAEIGLRPVV